MIEPRLDFGADEILLSDVAEAKLASKSKLLYLRKRIWMRILKKKNVEVFHHNSKRFKPGIDKPGSNLELGPEIRVSAKRRLRCIYRLDAARRLVFQAQFLWSSLTLFLYISFMGPHTD